ncbi:MAG: hypothetical protein PUP92_32335 [Rhizonema sp. PD38]|nr:hypothetical protein [Rhizonema sp. PD38]
MVIAKRLSKACLQSFLILLSVTVVSISFPTIASEEKPEASHKPEPLQTKMTQRDFKIIEQLVAIAQRKSASVQETKASMGLNAFVDIASIELSQSQGTSNSISHDFSSESEREHGFSVSVTIDPIKLLATIEKQPVMQARLNEAKSQKRVAVVKNYVAYLLAHQAAQIAAYKMQKLTKTTSIASLYSQATPPESVNYLTNPDYVAAATQMLTTNTGEQVALEELAASVGLSPQATIAIINGR